MNANITLRQLRAFVAVAESGQFTAAADTLCVTQAALSMLVKDLEDELGLKVFDRHTRMVRLTTSGQELLGMARRVLRDVEDGVQRTRETLSYARGRVALASATVLSNTLLVPFMARFRLDYPGIKLQFMDMAEQDLERALVDEEIDLGIGTYLEPHREITCTPLFTDTYRVAMPAAHPLARRRRIPWTALASEPLIALSPRSPLRRQLDSHLAALGITPNPVFEVSFPGTVFSMIRHGMGLSILPANARMLADAGDLVFRELGAPALQRTVGAFHLARRSPSPAAAMMLEALQAYVEAHRDRLA
ncbi:LysR family transcriptional regulator [Cupriavidus taiwanensis]|uniref:LysR family transcriptional regulator n=1 Tax=Cupriavidus taiwanensis TaxID=164546 RepID=UPI0025426A3A|nr:LysR family transcriptional regulator [Cupriavidus taiwanensis]MDK3024112.1 LysR family transcriptional regulator [Cupriavidus taiwanensis]